MLPRFLVVLGFLVGTLLAAPASAQSDADKATARNLFFEAKAAYDAGRYEEAAGLFERSNSIFPAPTAALGIARSLRDAGQLVRAHETYRAMIVAGVPEDASPAFKQALDAAKKDRGHRGGPSRGSGDRGGRRGRDPRGEADAGGHHDAARSVGSEASDSASASRAIRG